MFEDNFCDDYGIGNIGLEPHWCLSGVPCLAPAHCNILPPDVSASQDVLGFLM